MENLFLRSTTSSFGIGALLPTSDLEGPITCQGALFEYIPFLVVTKLEFNVQLNHFQSTQKNHVRLTFSKKLYLMKLCSQEEYK